MIGHMSRGEDIEHYADKYEERQEVLRNLNKKESGGFPEEDERESRKTIAMQRNPY